MIFALVGNQNSGKTTLFNQLTGSNQHVGNFPGVTVEQKIGSVRGQKNCQVVDLPGIYSLRPYTDEEIVTRNFILNEQPDGIINIIDATNMERNLYLTLQLISMKIPMVLALNMMDEVRSNGGSVHTEKLSELLGIPVVPISAIKNDGISELTRIAVQTAQRRQLPKVYDFCPSGPVHRCIHSVCHIIEDHALSSRMPARFAAIKFIEGDPIVTELLDLHRNDLDAIEHTIVQMEQDCGLDRNAAMADMRYNFIEGVCKACVIKCRTSREHLRSVRMDRILTGKYTAIPVFLLIMLGIFYLSFNVIGAFLSGILEMAINGLTLWTDQALTAYGLNPVVHSLIIDGVFAGVGGVLSFLPIIVTLFFFLSILEDTGYMARIAFVMDRLLRRIGLSGRSIVPMLIGFGCTVPAVMATRTLSSERDRRLTILLTPFMSCSAKIPIYGFFTAAFFAKHQALVMMGLYIFGILVGIGCAALLNRTAFRGNPVPFVMELPNYRFPSLRSVGQLMWDKAKDFLQRAFTVIFVATIVIWFLQTFDLRLNLVSDNTDSLLASVGTLLAPLFVPLGFGDWRISTALISGFIAKESVVSTLEILLAGSPLTGLFTSRAALSFLVFTLLYTPCVAAISAVKRELNSGWKAAGVAIAQTGVAWIVAGLVYLLAGVLG